MREQDQKHEENTDSRIREFVSVTPKPTLNRNFPYFSIALADGTEINLPAVAEPTTHRLKPGDKFILEPREDILEGERKIYEDQTHVLVTRGNSKLTSFIVTNDCIIPPAKKP